MRAHAARLEALRKKLAEADLEAMLVDSPSNRRYLSGFTGSSGAVLVTMSGAMLVTDSRYYERVEREAPDCELIRAGSAMIDTIGNTLQDLGLRRVGFEAMHVSVHKHQLLRNSNRTVEWTATTGLVGELRAIKDEDEIARLRRSAGVTDEAIAHAAREARPGMTERELVWLIEVFMREAGADGPAFDVIVGSGANGALPHHKPGNDRLQRRAPIVIDLGARVDGYCSDLTRTFSLQPPDDDEYETVWSLVQRANKAVVDGVRPGMTGKEADAIARDIIDAAGYGDMFGHGVGHGVGLDIHELPRVGSTAEDQVLQEGMVFTIEPGIYLPGRFGVRIEDLAVMLADGVELLSNAPQAPVLAQEAVAG